MIGNSLASSLLRSLLTTRDEVVESRLGDAMSIGSLLEGLASLDISCGSVELRKLLDELLLLVELLLLGRLVEVAVLSTSRRQNLLIEIEKKNEKIARTKWAGGAEERRTGVGGVGCSKQSSFIRNSRIQAQSSFILLKNIF